MCLQVKLGSTGANKAQETAKPETEKRAFAWPLLLL
jgi:hypothetical protein